MSRRKSIRTQWTTFILRGGQLIYYSVVVGLITSVHIEYVWYLTVWNRGVHRIGLHSSNLKTTYRYHPEKTRIEIKHTGYAV